MVLPQTITYNYNEKTVNTVFKLIKMIKEPTIKDSLMHDFMTALTDNDDRHDNFDGKTKEAIALNKAYSKLSKLQQKIVLRTFEYAITSSNIDSYSEKYLCEVKNLKDKCIK